MSDQVSTNTCKAYPKKIKWEFRKRASRNMADFDLEFPVESRDKFKGGQPYARFYYKKLYEITGERLSLKLDFELSKKRSLTIRGDTKSGKYFISKEQKPGRKRPGFFEGLSISRDYDAYMNDESRTKWILCNSIAFLFRVFNRSIHNTYDKTYGKIFNKDDAWQYLDNSEAHKDLSKEEAVGHLKCIS